MSPLEMFVHRHQDTPVRNRLLSALSPGDLRMMRPLLEPATLSLGQVLVHPHEPAGQVWFPESGIVSQIAVVPGGREIEVGVYGREGFGPAELLLGVDRGPYRHLVQADGTALTIAGSTLRDLARSSATLEGVLLRYIQVFAIQVGFTAVSNASNLIGGRLARWLLMCNDRLDAETLPLTHEFLGAMLSVRRSGVTDAIHVLEGERAIRATRGRIQVVDRQRLRRIAGGSYGVPEAEYERLIGPLASEPDGLGAAVSGLRSAEG